MVEAIEQLAADYRTVHRNELDTYDSFNIPVDKNVGSTYYQDDREIWKAEQKEKAQRLAAEEEMQ